MAGSVFEGGKGLFTAWDPASALRAHPPPQWVAVLPDKITPQLAAQFKQAGIALVIWEPTASQAGADAVKQYGAAGYIAQAETPAELAAAQAISNQIQVPKALVTNNFMSQYPPGWIAMPEAYTNNNPAATADQVTRDAKARGAQVVVPVIGLGFVDTPNGQQMSAAQYQAGLAAATGAGASGSAAYIAEQTSDADLNAYTGGVTPNAAAPGGGAAAPAPAAPAPAPAPAATPQPTQQPAPATQPAVHPISTPTAAPEQPINMGGQPITPMPTHPIPQLQPLMAHQQIGTQYSDRAHPATNPDPDPRRPGGPAPASGPPEGNTVGWAAPPELQAIFGLHRGTMPQAGGYVSPVLGQPATLNPVAAGAGAGFAPTPQKATIPPAQAASGDQPAKSLYLNPGAIHSFLTGLPYLNRNQPTAPPYYHYGGF